MILKALYDYYQRKSEELPPFGTIFQQIHFILVIDRMAIFFALKTDVSIKTKRHNF